MCTVLIDIEKYKTQDNNHFYKVHAVSDKQYDFYIVIDTSDKKFLSLHKPDTLDETFFASDINFLSDDPEDSKRPSEIPARIYYRIFIKAYNALKNNHFPNVYNSF